MSSATMPLASASQALHESPWSPIRSLVIAETDSEVTLSGQVHSYYFKQLAQETILPALGGRRLVNRIMVNPQS